MFLFNKNAALPRSRQSSVDSLGTDPSNSGAWASQCSDSSSQREVISPEPRETLPAKRTSVFHLRPRSNTSASTMSITTLSTTMTGMSSSQDLRSMTSSPATFVEIPGPRRSLFARARRSRRQSNQLPSEVDAKRFSVLRKDQNRRGAEHISQGPSTCTQLLFILKLMNYSP